MQAGANLTPLLRPKAMDMAKELAIILATQLAMAQDTAKVHPKAMATALVNHMVKPPAIAPATALATELVKPPAMALSKALAPPLPLAQATALDMALATATAKLSRLLTNQAKPKMFMLKEVLSSKYQTMVHKKRRLLMIFNCNMLRTN